MVTLYPDNASPGITFLELHRASVFASFSISEEEAFCTIWLKLLDWTKNQQ